MNKNIEIFQINWESLGAKLAHLTTDEQIPFFKGFCNEMLKYPSNYDMEMQLAFIRGGMGDQKGFTKEQKEIFLSLGHNEELT